MRVCTLIINNYQIIRMMLFDLLLMLMLMLMLMMKKAYAGITVVGLAAAVSSKVSRRERGVEVLAENYHWGKL